ncbi:MAG: ABC transporter substrate-binding protein [Lachnospiraceae bacterium]
MKKRLLALLLCGVMMTLSLAACGSSDSGSSSDDATATEETSDSGSSSGTTLTFMASQDWVYDAEMELGKQFEEETGIKIDYQIVPSDQYYNLLMTKLNSGEGPDIFGGQSGAYDIVTQYNVEKNAVDLSGESWIDYYNEFEKAETSVDDKVYGMTYFDTTTDYYIIYNKAIFDEYNLKEPTTFAEFEEVCQTLLDNGVSPVYEPAADGWHHVMWFAEVGGVFEKLEPGVIDKLNNNEIKFADVPEFEEAMTQVLELAEKGYFGDNYLSDEYTDTASVIGSGEFAMAFGKPGSIAEYVEASNGTYTEDDFAMFVPPILDNDILNVHPCGPSRFIYSGSENIDAAKQYLEYIATQESIQYMIDNEAKVENLPYSADQTPKYSAYTEEFLASFEEQGTVLQDSVKYFNPQWMDIGTDMTAMFIGDMTPKEVIAAIDKRRETQAVAAGDEAWQ